MRKLIGVVAVSLLIVAFLAPVGGAQAVGPVVCSEQTSFTQPSSPPPYTMQWKGFKKRVIVKGSVAGAFTGTCRGFLSGKVKIVVRSPNGGVLERSRTFENLEFKNGYLDTGRRFTFRYGLVFRNPIPAGTCFTVTVRWDAWRYNDNELVADDSPKILRSQGCYKAK